MKFGYRLWYVEGYYLRSTAILNNFWQPGLNTAACLRCLPHEASYSSILAERHLREGICGCGFYAFKEPMNIVPDTGLIIYGEVALYGWIVPHEAGYRAQYAEVSALVDTPSMCANCHQPAELVTRTRLTARIVASCSRCGYELDTPLRDLYRRVAEYYKVPLYPPSQLGFKVPSICDISDCGRYIQYPNNLNICYYHTNLLRKLKRMASTTPKRKHVRTVDVAKIEAELLEQL